MSGTTTTRAATGWRFARIRRDDSLQAIAAREMGDASRWAEIAALNDLEPPYLTADPLVAAASRGRIKLFGEAIRIFAPTAQVNPETEADDVFGADLALTRGRLTVANGDFEIVAGRPNLAATLSRRVLTKRGELLFHPSYGADVRRLLGRGSGPIAAALATRSVRLALEQDARVARVIEVTARVEGDRTIITAVLVPVGSDTTTTISAGF